MDINERDLRHAKSVEDAVLTVLACCASELGFLRINALLEFIIIIKFGQRDLID